MFHVNLIFNIENRKKKTKIFLKTEAKRKKLLEKKKNKKAKQMLNRRIPIK